MFRKTFAAATLLTALVAAGAACGGDDDDEERVLTVYSGRAEELVQPLIDQFEDESGITVEVNYAGTTELAATILEEGDNSPADVFFAQDAGALGALQAEERLSAIRQDSLDRVDEAYRSPEGLWVGTSGRARVIVYNTEMIDPAADLPESIHGFTDPEWSGRIGWAPTNGSFQAWVTALRLVEGEEAARTWLEGVAANDPMEYSNNTGIVEAVAAGEVEVGFVNHYYLYRFLAEAGDDFTARNYTFPAQDIGNLVNVSGVAILDGTDDQDEAEEFVEFLLSEQAQQYFADETFEYPLIEGVDTHPDLPALTTIAPPAVDIADLGDLEGTVALLQEVGVLP